MHLTHPNHVLKVIKPIYEKLSAKSWLERCLGAETQNNNESLNSLVCTFALKYIYCGRPSIEISTFLAVDIFNEGFPNILTLLSEMSEIYANARDKGVTHPVISYTYIELDSVSKYQFLRCANEFCVYYESVSSYFNITTLFCSI